MDPLYVLSQLLIYQSPSVLTWGSGIPGPRPAAVFHCLLSAPGASRRKPLLPLITSFLQVCFCEPIPLSMCGYRDAPSSGSHPSPPSSAAALVIIAKKPECDTDRSQCRDASGQEHSSGITGSDCVHGMHERRYRDLLYGMQSCAEYPVLI